MLQKVIKQREDVFGEIPLGDIDNVNQEFTTEFPFQDDSLRVHLNGLRLRNGVTEDFVIVDDQTFVLNETPIIGDSLEIDYIKK